MNLNENNRPEVNAVEYMKVCQERDGLQRKLEALSARNAELLVERDSLLAEVDGLEKDLKTAQTRVDITKATNAGLKAGAEDLQKQIKDYEEVVERLKAQNSRFVEEQREAKQRADATAVSLIKTKDEVARLVTVNNSFADRLKAVTTEKDRVVEISNGFARERDEIRAEYDARGKVIKKLRKRLHKLKKKLKH